MVKYHQEYICDCNKYSADLSVKHKGEYVFTVTNTGTGPLCKDYILCGKYIKKSNCDNYILLPGESMEIRYQGPRRKQMVSIYFQIDNDNWIKSNAVLIYPGPGPVGPSGSGQGQGQGPVGPSGSGQGGTELVSYLTSFASGTPSAIELYIKNLNNFTVYDITVTILMQKNPWYDYTKCSLTYPNPYDYHGLGDTKFHITHLSQKELSKVVVHFDKIMNVSQENLFVDVLFDSTSMNIMMLNTDTLVFPL